MHILAFNGSPSKKGSGAALINAILSAARKNGHTAEVIDLYGKKIKGCLACNKCKDSTPECAVKDDMAAITKKIIKADCLIISSPVYMGQISGVMKTFLDRWCVFFDGNFKMRHIPGKQLVTIVTSGAPAATYKTVADYLNKWLGGFFKMKLAGSIVAGGLSGKGAVKKQQDVMKQAAAIGRGLK
jgi:multimeric flavodoxin WrbA